MPKRRYYSVRTGKNPKSAEVDLKTLGELFLDAYRRWDETGYFQEHFGYDCVDAGRVPGKLGDDLSAALRFHLRKTDLWPIHSHIDDYSEDDLFDIIEFFHDHISKPLQGKYHSYSQCGYHYDTFDADKGRTEYRATLNELLQTYLFGYELSNSGEILECAQPGMENLLHADLPTDDSNIKTRYGSAIAKFRRHRSTLEERRDAVRDLADVLEYLRPKLKEVLNKTDETDLFNIANNFGIRHHNDKQKTNYDMPIWLSWIFYFYLATIHASLRLLEQRTQAEP
jgi:hypothetical protein